MRPRCVRQQGKKGNTMSHVHRTPLRNLAYALGLLMAPLLATPAVAEGPTATRVVEVVVQNGYHPARIELPSGQKVRLRFVRKEYGGCSKEVVFPAFGVRRELPPHEPVDIELTPPGVGEYEFHCGMNMIRGKVVVTASAP